jgi:predicted phage terminase large subunit-like protein
VYFNTLLDAQHVEVERCRPSAETFTDSQRLRRVADLESFWYSGPVHDLTVEEDSSYQGVSVTFHNSDDFYGFLAGQDHRKDASGQTISTYRHTLIGPNVFHVKALSPDPITGEEVSFWPEKFPLDYLLQKRRNAGAVNFALQYQNDPQLTAGGIIRVEDLEPYMWALPSDRPSNDQLTIFQGVDPAIGEKENNDFFAHCTIGVSADLHIYVLEIHLLKISFDKQVKFIIDQYHKYNTEKVAIETIAYQQALSQAVRQRDAWLDILEVKPRKDKTQRARIFSAYCERHEVHLHTLHYHLMETLVGMPNVDHDDSFDALDLAVEAAKQHVLMDTLVMRLDTNFRKR